MFAYDNPSNSENFYFKFEITDRIELEQITRIVSIDNVKGLTVYAYATLTQLTKLSNLGYKVEFLPISGSAKDLTMATTVAQMANWDRYPTYDVYLAMMAQFASDYPNICRLENLGTSVEGRDILTVKISDNPDIEEDEAEFFYTAQMHGNEIVTYILMLRLIDYLLSNYGFDPEVTKMVNEIEIWINPLANPDGTYDGGNNTVSGADRENANGVDLNRNFPDPEDGPHPDGHAWQPETIIMMDFAEAHSLIHSANFHSGAEVVNYPWDTWNILHADDDWYIDISKAYADTVFAFAPYGYFRGISSTGYIRGYAWYTTNGNRQDYMNWFHHCREVTIEQSNTKLLSSDLLPAHWTYNKRSLINYIKNVYYGIRGLVTDSLGNPLDAKITVVGHDFDHSEVYTDPDVGDYHRMILPGTYDITASAYAFIPQTITDITVVDTGAVRVDVILQEAESVDITGTVRDGDTQQLIIGAKVEIVDSVHAPVYTGFDGVYAIENVMEGTYTFKVSADGYSTLTEDITVTEDNHVINFELYEPYMFWDFEQNDGDFTSNYINGWQWGEPTAGGITAYSGSKLWGTNISGFYQNNAEWTLDSPTITMSNNPMLAFYHIYNFEGGSNLWDGGNVSISTDGGTSFTVIDPITSYDGTISALGESGFGGMIEEWILVQFDLHEYGNEDVIIRWHFASDGSVANYYGWYVDDVAIVEQISVDVPGTEHEFLISQNFPNPFNNSTTISFLIPSHVSDGKLTIYNIKGQLVKETTLQPAQTTFSWDGTDDTQQKVSSGIYFYKITSKNYTSIIKKMLYLQK